MKDLLARHHLMYCLVDSSWTRGNEVAGIGWKLFDKSGKGVMSGSSSIDPIGSALEAEAYGLRDAVFQMKKFGYRNVAFAYDSETLHKALMKCLDDSTMGGNQKILTYCKDIGEMVRDEVDRDFKFYVVSRLVVHDADALAKQARQLRTSYVIKWFLV